jgi:hypothetical protein
MDTLYHKTWVVRSAASCVVATSRAVARERLKEGHAKDSRQKQIGEARSSERIGLQCSVVLASGFIGMEEKDRARLNHFVTLQMDPWATAYD